MAIWPLNSKIPGSLYLTFPKLRYHPALIQFGGLPLGLTGMAEYSKDYYIVKPVFLK